MTAPEGAKEFHLVEKHVNAVFFPLPGNMTGLVRDDILRTDRRHHRCACGKVVIQTGKAFFAHLKPPVRSDRCGELVHLANKIRHKQIGRRAINFGRGSDLLNHALIHHHDPVRHRQRFFLIMGHHHRGHAQLALKLFDFVAQVHPHFCIQRGQGFIQQ